MTYQSLISAGALAVAVASVSLAVDPVTAQAPATRTSYLPPKSTYVPPKTPWGDPDIQGIYIYPTSVPIERPAPLTDAELAQRKKASADPVGSYNDFWLEPSSVKGDDRTSLVMDSPDGRFPPLTPEAEKRRKEILASGYDGTRWNSLDDIHPLTRCIAAQTPSGPFPYNGAVYIMQAPGWVMLVRERLDTRMIALDGRPHIGQNIRQWNGDSRGHWEGNTLVVDVTNFTDKQKGSSQTAGRYVNAGHPFGNFHVTERFVPISPTRLHVYSTVEDPTTWTKPWTVMLPYELQPGYQIFEYACHEGDLTVGYGLRGQRVLDAAAAEKSEK